jgi:hypothetical protein
MDDSKAFATAQALKRATSSKPKKTVDDDSEDS